MELLLSKTPEDDVRKHVLPLVYNALDSDASKVQVKVLTQSCFVDTCFQELCMGIIPSIGRLVDRDSMKSQLLPKLLYLSTDAQVLSVRVNSLVSIGKLLPTLEKWMIAEQVLPTLPKIQSKEPGVLMAVLGDTISQYNGYSNLFAI
jgi:SCY1-like protein 2